jgi:L-ascorbate metabolism protein UlaG (beta-lactamase superfamily)
MLAPKGAYPGFPGTARADIRNPMVECLDVNTLLDDAVIVTHTHDDHWDQTAIELIAKDKPVYVQNDRMPRCCAARGLPT